MANGLPLCEWKAPLPFMRLRGPVGGAAPVPVVNFGVAESGIAAAVGNEDGGEGL